MVLVDRPHEDIDYIVARARLVQLTGSRPCPNDATAG